MTSIIEKLRAKAVDGKPDVLNLKGSLMMKAADEIDRLQAALAREMQTEQGEYCSVCGFHGIECGGHSDEDYARAATANNAKQ